jgi:alkanesulfonate monooxygenase SsuD/methylene tetrahydromethanopterin reductase-like flavin-dependent oxidoreductase (luciferase family)
MRFGLLYEQQLPRPWFETSEQELFHQAIEQVELADGLGIDYIWEVEHHFQRCARPSSMAGGGRNRAGAHLPRSQPARRIR